MFILWFNVYIPRKLDYFLGPILFITIHTSFILCNSLHLNLSIVRCSKNWIYFKLPNNWWRNFV